MTTPATIIQNILIEEGIASDPDNTVVGDLPCYYSLMPNDPDNVFAAFDTMGYKRGRLMLGKSVIQDGYQLRIRHLDPALAYTYITAAAELLEGLTEHLVMVGDDIYTVHGITRMPPIPLGTEAEGRRRTEFTVNGLIVFSNS